MNSNTILKTYGISQSPDTKDFILVLQILPNEYFEKYCENCYKIYDNINYKWCKPCQISYLKNNFTEWTSGNNKIDDFIQKKQFEIYYYNNVVFEWIPYNQFNNIKVIGKNDHTIVH